MMQVTFSGVTVTIIADDPKAAYSRLCEVLEAGVAAGDVEYATDTYCTQDDDEDRDTTELMP